MKLTMASGQVVDLPGVPDDATFEPLTVNFGIKSSPEVEIDGEVGLLCQGYASLYNETDQDGEHQIPGAFADLMDAWALEPEPLVIYHHGYDPELGARRIGRGMKSRLDDKGFYAEVFIPKDPKFKDARARRRFGEVYSGIKKGAVRGYSVGGGFIRAGKALVRWATTELSITPTACLEKAEFALGRKALIDAYGDMPPSLSVADGAEMDDDSNDDGLVDQATLPLLSRPAWGQVMATAQAQGDESLHDHLLYREARYQGAHNPESCPICTTQRRRQGIKALTVTKPPAPRPRQTTRPGANRANRPADAGKKAALVILLRDRPDLLKAATDLMTEVTDVGHGEKIGRRHSKKDLAVVGGIIGVLQTHFGLGDADDDNANGKDDDAGTGAGTGVSTS